MATFQKRLKAALGPEGYQPCMRRSVQSVLLFEARRCVEDKLPSMRPFQRKIAFCDQAYALLGTLDFIPPHQKGEIMWRTGTSKEQLQPDVAWKRRQLIERELANLAKKVMPYMDGNSHAEACDLLVQELYEAKQKQENPNVSTEALPKNWIHAHNNVWLTFRIYYKGDQLDPSLPAPKPPKDIVIPQYRPRPGDQASFASLPNNFAAGTSANANTFGAGFAAPSPQQDDSTDNRKKILSEVREHLELLKEFEGVVPDEELNKRKRDLFMALPPAPPPFAPDTDGTDSAKRARM